MSKKNLQLTIDFMLNKTDNYFCLKWERRDEPEDFPYFCGQRMENSNFSYGFLNKLLHLPIIVSGNIKLRKDKLKVELPIPKDIPVYTNIHFLKSHLQKSIRLKKTNLAIPTAKHLIEIDPIQFLRRLAIIFVEDVMITQHYSTLIWLMIAISSKKITLQLNHIEWLLGLVYIACECKWKENYNVPEMDDFSNEKYAKHISDLSQNLDKYQQAIIQSLIIRSSFGGMQGDTRMLLNAAYIWYNRFIGEDIKWKEYYYQPIRTISASVIPLEKSDWILSAIDYHCFPKMTDWIMDKLEENMEEEEIKSLIWNFSSKTNYRKNYDCSTEQFIGNEKRWEIIKKQVLSIQKYAIKNFS